MNAVRQRVPENGSRYMKKAQPKRRLVRGTWRSLDVEECPFGII